MAESSRTSLRYIKETTFGVAPTGEYTPVNFTEENFTLNRTKDRKKKILPTREYSGMNSKTESTEGGFKNPLQITNTDELFEGVLMSSWGGIENNVEGSKLIAGAAGSNLDIIFTQELSSGAGGIIIFGTGHTNITLLLDQWLFVSGTEATGADNNGAYIVTEVINAQEYRVNAPLVTGAYQAADCEISSDVIRNGSTIASYQFERAHLDINKFFQYAGQVLSTMEIMFTPETEVELSFDFMGKNETISDVTISSPAPTSNAGPDVPDFITGDNVKGVFIDYVELAECLIQELKISIDNQTETRKSIAVFGPCGARIKPIDVTGNINLFFNDTTQYQKYPLDTEFQLAIAISDPNGMTYGFTLASTEFTTGAANASDMEDEVIEEHEFAVSTNGVFTVQICKSVA